MKQILYGVGKSILKDFVDPTKVLGLSKLKDVSVAMSGSEEEVTGGDSPYAITTFPKDKSVTIKATNALFSMKMLNATQGTEVIKGQVNFHEVIDFLIPADGIASVEHTPIAETTTIDGFVRVDDVVDLATGKFYVDTTNSVIKFDTSDAGKDAEGVYQWQSSSNAETLSVLKDSVAKPFTFIHRIPVYDDNSKKVAEGQLIVYKAKSKGDFNFNFAPQTAFAPELELTALDPKRPDKKLWDFTIDHI